MNRVLVIGYGSAGKRHAEIASKLGWRVHVVDPSPYRRDEADSQDFHASADIRSSHYDAAIIASPLRWHTLNARDLLHAGYGGPLFVEKPVCMDATDDVWRSWPHQTTMVGYNLRWHPWCQTLIGDWSGPYDRFDFTLWCDMGKWPGTYGHFLYECSHEVDLLLACGLQGSVLSASMDEASRTASVWFDNGRAHLEIRALSPRLLRRWSASGPEGSVAFTHTTMSALSTRAMYRAQLKQFLAAAVAGDRTPCSFVVGLETVKVCQDIMKAVRA